MYVVIPVSLSLTRLLFRAMFNSSVISFPSSSLYLPYFAPTRLPLLLPPLSFYLKTPQPIPSPSPLLPINPNNPNTPLDLPPPLLSLRFPPRLTPESRKQTRRSRTAASTHTAAALAVHPSVCVAVVVVAVLVVAGLIIRTTASI